MPDFDKFFGNVKKNTYHINSRVTFRSSFISCITDSNWAIHESLGINPDWEGVKSLLLRKCLNREL